MSQPATGEQFAPSRQAGDRSESAVLELVDGLRYVPDTESAHHDAVGEELIGPTDNLPFVGICVLEPGVPIEIKSVSVVYGERQRRGRFQPRRTQHEWLVDAGGVYLFAVCSPHDRDVIAAKVVPATQVDHLIHSLCDGWRSAGDGREEYVQFSWARVFDPDELEKSGGASA